MTTALRLLPLALLLAACDAGLEGDAFDNQPPETQLAVQSRTLVGNVPDRLSSTLTVNWSGTDADGYVDAFEIRFFDQSAGAPGPDEGWTRTAARDTTVLLPIARGQSEDDVAFEVRAIDNDGAADPTPASTVYPIRNARPSLRLIEADLPPDTTLGVFSFAFEADDPEGEGDLQRFEIGLNDSTTYVDLGTETTFFTVVADPAEPGATETTAQVFAGQAFRPTGITIPGVRLDADNRLYVRAADATETFSDTSRADFFVRRRTSDVLFVNDLQTTRGGPTAAFHRSVLEAYGGAFDTYTLTDPGAPIRSRLLPRLADPTLRALLRQYRHVYFLSQSVLASARTESLPFAAPALADLVERGGSILVISPTGLDETPEANADNPALPLLPVASTFAKPDSLQRLTVGRNGEVVPAREVPGTGQTLPPLANTGRPIITLAPLVLEAGAVPLYTADFGYRTLTGRSGDWDGPATVAAISADRTVAFLALPLVDDDGSARFAGDEGGDAAPREALRLLLESLRFPTN